MKPETKSAEHALAQSYDTTPYTGNPYYYTHPSILAAYGALYGLGPPAPDRSRVLELGCGDAGNLIPMAYDLPRSEFLGIDLSSVQIGIGQKSIEALGLKNIRLETRSIMDVGAADGKFDYIIVHGVYSWVPDAARKKILEICRENLSDHGIAHISYNVLPGWRFNQSMRDMILYCTRNMEEPKQRVATVLDLFNTMIAGVSGGDSAHDVELRSFAKTLKSMPDVPGYLLHEYMEPDNTSFYFYQFAGDLQKNGLQYICDAEQHDFELDALPPDVATKFETMSEDGIEVEQFIDFLKNTRFRRSLVCRRGIDIDSTYRPERIRDLYAATEVVPISNVPDKTSGETIAYKTSSGRQFSTQHQFAQTILRLLSVKRPCSMPVGALIEAVARESASESNPDMHDHAEKIGHAVYSLFFNGVLDLLGVGRRCVLDSGEYPTASPISRLQASSHHITNLCHRVVLMNDDDMAVFVLAHLDGTRNRDTLVDLMTEAVRTGRVRVPNLNPEGKKLDDIRISMRDQLGAILRRLLRSGFLFGNSDRS